MQIQDVERKTGLDRATIRFYEKEDLVVPDRNDNGYRNYQQRDIEQLLRIKLLRQLGVSVNKIKMLQQGSGDFASVLSEQIKLLESRIRDDNRAMVVCVKMRNDGVLFDDLDAPYYLNMLASAPSTAPEVFSEPIEHESHPWRRYFARYLDYRIIAAGLNVLFVVILRIRPFHSNAITALNYTAYFLTVPILAALLCVFGTTPGKWSMGIRLESIHGGKLSGGEALYREGKILWHGFGLFIPILEIWRQYRSYQHEKNGIMQPWNEDTEIIHEEWSVCRKCVAALIFIVSLSLSLYAGFDAVMPTYRSDRITIKEFAENHNDYASVPYAENTYQLGSDGNWICNFSESLEQERPNFVYKLNESGEIIEISYSESLESAYPVLILPKYCEQAICVAVGSRPGSTYRDVVNIPEILESQWYSKLPQKGGESEGCFTVRDVRVQWYTYIDGCKFISDGTLFAEDNAAMTYDLKMIITFDA